MIADKYFHHRGTETTEEEGEKSCICQYNQVFQKVIADSDYVRILIYFVT